MAKGWRTTKLHPLEGRKSVFVILNEISQVISIVYTKGTDNYQEIERCLKGIAARQGRLQRQVCSQASVNMI